MPIHDVGYRPWSGPLTSNLTRWWTITEAGVAGAFKSRWVRRAMLLSWLPILNFGVAVFMFEQMMDQPTSDLLRGLSPEEVRETTDEFKDDLARKVIAQELMEQFEFLPESNALFQAAETNDKRIMRHQVWSYILAMFLRYPQGVMTLLLVGLVVPPLISRDVRSRAFLLYYSRPITRLEYLMGKIAIPASLLFLITLVPAMGLYLFGLMLSPDLTVVLDTWDLPFRIAAATAVCIIPVCLLSLLFSSLTQESRFAGFAWFAVWGMGTVVWMMIYLNTQAQVMAESNGVTAGNVTSHWSLVSLYSTIGRVQSWMFGLETDFTAIIPSLTLLVIISVVSFVWLYRRISAPVRV